MRDFIHQHEKELILFIGCGLIPAAMIRVLFLMDYPYGNVTGLLNDPFWKIPTHITALLMLWHLVFCLYRIGIRTKEKKTVVHDLSILVFLIVATVFMPYVEYFTIYSLAHVILALLSLYWLNYLFLTYCGRSQTIKNIYIFAFSFSVLHCLTYGEITGTAEIVYGLALSVLVSVEAANA